MQMQSLAIRERPQRMSPTYNTALHVPYKRPRTNYRIEEKLSDTVHVQCVYGESHLLHLQTCLIPALASATSRPIKLLTINYDPASPVRLVGGQVANVQVVDVLNTATAKTGFAGNHNTLFKFSRPSEDFIIINPDCIPHAGCIDTLIARKTKSKERVGIVEGRQWPFEHPKEYDSLTLHTPWASGAFALIDAGFYDQIGGMDDLYFLYMEDVDLSWQAWLNDYAVLYEPASVVTHFSGGHFYRPDMVSAEEYLSLRNFIVISRKIFGVDGEKRAIKLLEAFHDKELANVAIDEYLNKFQTLASDKYQGMRNPHVKIVGLNQFHELRNV
jgi:hypothetical protein